MTESISFNAQDMSMSSVIKVLENEDGTFLISCGCGFRVRTNELYKIKEVDVERIAHSHLEVYHSPHYIVLL